MHIKRRTCTCRSSTEHRFCALAPQDRSRYRSFFLPASRSLLPVLCCFPVVSGLVSLLVSAFCYTGSRIIENKPREKDHGETQPAVDSLPYAGQRQDCRSGSQVGRVGCGPVPHLVTVGNSQASGFLKRSRGNALGKGQCPANYYHDPCMSDCYRSYRQPNTVQVLYSGAAQVIPLRGTWLALLALTFCMTVER
jgi:hypothetical protein